MNNICRIALALVALGAIVLVAVESAPARVGDVDCTFEGSSAVSVEIKRLPTRDRASLMKIGSYFSYPVGDQNYQLMELLMRGVEARGVPKGTEFSLDLTCANLTFTVTDDGAKSWAHDGRVDLKVPNKGHKSCHLSPINSWTAAEGKHYECFNEKIYHCKANGETVLEFVVESLEFEIGGSKGAHAAGNFTTPRQSCSFTTQQ